MQRVLRLLYQPYKWLFLIPAMALFTAFFGGLAALFSGLEKSGTAARYIAVFWARINAIYTPMRVHIRGQHHIAPKQSYVIVSNHQSQYDILLMYGWLGTDFRWVMKKELRRVPVLGLACEKLGHIYVDRSDSAAAVASLNAARKKLVNGTSVVFFPEGTRSRDGELGLFKKGAFRMALDLGLPILPVTIRGTRAILRPDTLDIFPGSAGMIIHPPVAVKDYSREDLPELIENIRNIIRESL